VYSHYNLHDTSLLDKPINVNLSFFDYSVKRHTLVSAAAPLSMGLLTRAGPPEWHPASDELRQACHLAADICDQNGVDISTIALLFALSNPKIATTVLGMSCIEEVKAVHTIALRCKNCKSFSLSHNEVLLKVLSEAERKALEIIRDPVSGPFAALWKNGLYQWDGIQIAQNFWKLQPEKRVVHWQSRHI
jgi:hypothetical protein